MIICGTGHRPNKLGGWDIPQHSFDIPMAVACESMDGVIGVVSGGAAGWDLALAHAAIELDLPLYMAIPFEGQDSKWSKYWRQKYDEAREYAVREVIIADTYSNKAFLDRNKWMVDYVQSKQGLVLALWNGDTRGGTAHCVNYAHKQGVEVVNLWDDYVAKLRLAG